MSRVKKIIKDNYQYEFESLSETLIDWEKIPKWKNDKDSIGLTLLGIVLCMVLIFFSPLVAVHKNTNIFEGELLIMHIQNYTNDLSSGGHYDKS